MEERKKETKWRDSQEVGEAWTKTKKDWQNEKEREMRQKRRKGGRKMHKVGGSNDRRAREREEKVQLASAAMPV